MSILTDQPGLHEALDTLTALPTRWALEEHLSDVLWRTRSESGRVGVFFADLDRLSSVNEGFGHATGDELLRCLVRRLQSLLRDGDFVARFGGDSFVVVCPGLDGERGAITIAERMVELSRQPVGTEAGPFTLTLSVGVALATDPDASAPDLVRDASAAMHTAKERGGDGYAIFDPVVRGRAVRALEIERELRHAIEHGELCLHYQPVVSLPGGDVLAFEALVRWNHPLRGMLPPADFIPVAERCGLIVDLGEWALRAACRQIAAWTPASPGPNWAQVAVNVSAKQIASPSFVPMVRRALAESGIEGRRLAVEITETALIDASATVAGVLAELKDLGLRVILDDFGTGYSSLGYLARFPVDALKLDRSFISGEEADRSTPIIEAVAGMAHSLGLHLVGEGVETREQCEMLQAIGCDFAQGFHFARPMTPERVPGWVASSRDAIREGVRDVAPAGREKEDTVWLSLGDAAEALSVSPSTLRRWSDEGKIPMRRTEGGHRRFAIHDVKRASSARTSTPKLRVGPSVEQPIPGLADLLYEQAPALADTAARGLYERHSSGWFATERARPALHNWARRLAMGARVGQIDEALNATAQLTRQAEACGASLLEISLFLERFAALAITAARPRQDGEEQAQSQRYFKHVRRQPLRDR